MIRSRVTLAMIDAAATQADDLIALPDGQSRRAEPVHAESVGQHVRRAPPRDGSKAIRRAITLATCMPSAIALPRLDARPPTRRWPSR